MAESVGLRVFLARQNREGKRVLGNTLEAPVKGHSVQ
jgi:hypothetical protein